MSEKVVMDYKKQRIGKPEAVNSLSIKESHASLNEESDSEKIELFSHKRKHKVTPRNTQQSDSNFELESNEGVYMGDSDVYMYDEDMYLDDDISSRNVDNFSIQHDTFISPQNDDYHSIPSNDISDDGYFYGVQLDEELNEQDDDAFSTASDDFHSVKSSNTDNNEDFYDIEFDDVDEDGQPTSINSSYTHIPSESIPESPANIVYEDMNNIIEISSDDSVHSEMNKVTDQVYEEEQDPTSESESHSLLINSNSDMFSFEFNSNAVSNTQAVNLANPDEDELMGSEDEILSQNTFNNEYEVENSSPYTFGDELEVDESSSQYTFDNESEVDELAEPEVDEPEVYELDESEDDDDEGLVKVEPDNETNINNSLVQDHQNITPHLRDTTDNLYMPKGDIENFDDVNLAEIPNQDSEDNGSVLLNMYNPVYSSSDINIVEDVNDDEEDLKYILKVMNDSVYSPQQEPSISRNNDMAEYVENNVDTTISVSNSLPSPVNVEPESSVVLEVANEKDDDEHEFLLAHTDRHVYSSDNKSENTIVSELLETIDIEMSKVNDIEMSEENNIEMSEMTGIEWSEVTDATNTEPREVVNEQECTEAELLLEAMNRSYYNNEICVNSGLNDHIVTTENENISCTDIDTSSTESMVINMQSEFEAISRAVMEMLDKKNAEILASVDKLTSESFDSMEIDYNSNSVDYDSIVPNTRVQKINNIDEHLENAKNLLKASKNFKNQSSARIWWYDAYESYEGFLYLFGKVFDKTLNAYTSCCVTVENIQREIYILPRKYQTDKDGHSTIKPATINDVKAELKEVLSSHNIKNYRMETCNRKYAFGIPDVPREAEYIKLNYPYTDHKFPRDTAGLTFGHMFGTTVTPLENFLIQKNIMGPCWLEFNNLKESEGNSWCMFETRIESPDNCFVIESNETPSLNLLSLNVQTKFNNSTKNNDIVAISGFYYKNADINKQDTATSMPFEKFSINRTISSTGSSKRTVETPEDNCIVIQESSEKLMLYTFLAKLQTYDADIIIGHEFSTISLSVLLQRMRELKIEGWSKIGRRKIKKWPKFRSELNNFDRTTYQEKLTMCGRLVCDTFTASQDLVNCRSYSLQDMALSELGISRKEITSEMMKTFEEQGVLATELARYGLFDAYLAMSIAVNLKILPLTQQLSNLAGNLWSRCMYGARSERNEYLLLHSFYNEGYICPDRPDWENKPKGPLFIDESLEMDYSRKEKTKSDSSSYVGGLVLDPKSGIYDDYILLLDFNSLYPSIIREYNVCFTTMEQDFIGSANYNAQDIPSTPGPDTAEGTLPKLVDIFVNRRKDVKDLMKNPYLSENDISQCNIEQMALKLTANSMYGCLGSPTSRFYARQLAMFITSKGRDILQSTVDITEQLGYEVVYGDTDSIMVNTKAKSFDEAKQIGEKIKEAVNQKYRVLEIGTDGYFKRTLLLKKKKYAMLSVDDRNLTETVGAKGLDLVRRDWCELSHIISENVLNKILFDQKNDAIHEYLVNISEKIYNAEYSVDDFIIRKQLNKSPEEYDRKKFFPHVYVAKNMRRAHKPVKAGDTIAYVMCKSDGDAKPCIPEDVKTGKEEINIDWYICKQILPPVYRLCQPIDGVNIDTLSRCFGLDEDRVAKNITIFNEAEEAKGGDMSYSSTTFNN